MQPSSNCLTCAKTANDKDKEDTTAVFERHLQPSSNVGGRSTEKIGEALLSSNIYSADNIHSEGFHLCTLVTYRAKMVDQIIKCTQFIDSIDSFLNKYYGSRLHLTILKDCIKDKKDVICCQD